jgi:hypothetical protein
VRSGDGWPAASGAGSGDAWAASAGEAAPVRSAGSGDAWRPSEGERPAGAWSPAPSPQPPDARWTAGPVVPEPSPPSAPPGQVFVPAPEHLGAPVYPPDHDPWPAPPAERAPAPEPAPPRRPAPAPPRGARPTRRPPTRSARRGIDRRRLAVVYDTDGPRIRLGVAWFLVAMAATVISPATTAAVYAVAAGMAGRQIVRAWGNVSWQADLAAGIGAVPVLVALGGTRLLVASLVLGGVVAIGAACAPDGALLRGRGGRVATAGILSLALVPAFGAACIVLVRSESVVSAVVLVLLASAYEVGDYIVGSGSSNSVEGPLAGITTATLIALPLSLVLVEPFDTAGMALVAFAAVAYPFGQILASALLPGAAAPASALRRIDTLLLLAPLWAAASGVF